MNIVLIVVSVIVLLLLGGFVGYWIGVDKGEKASTWYADAYSRSITELNNQKLENRRLQAAMDFYDTDRLRSILDQIDDGPGPWSGQG